MDTCKIYPPNVLLYVELLTNKQELTKRKKERNGSVSECDENHGH